LVENTKAKYSIEDKDTYNFKKSSFIIGVILTGAVVTGSKPASRPELVQPGDREWVTVIQSICAARYATPPFIIYKGRVYISA
ncbi:uncharacterized protein M421DRAFT_66379, partial [Didymella exigua CBS 183.55]